MDKEELYHILLERDAKAQATVAIEELAELQKELTKYIRGKLDKSNLLEEYVDVTIMLEQLRILFNFSDRDIQLAKDYKLKRIEERLRNNSL